MATDAASDLAKALGAAVGERLAPRGWRPIEQQLRPPGYVGAFTLPLRDGFAAVTKLSWTGPFEVMTPEFRLGVPEDAEVRRIDLDASTLEVAVSVGVCFEPLLELLDAIDGSGIRDIVSERVEELEASPSSSVMTVRSLAEVPQAADALAHSVFDHAVPFAERYASVDAMIDALGDQEWSDPDHADYGERLLAALLVAAGRFERAREVLAKMEATGEKGMSWMNLRKQRRLIRQLLRWIDAEGQLRMPTSRASWPSPADLLCSKPLGEPPRVKDLFAKGRERARIAREALEAARQRDMGQDRQELAVILEEEWRRRGLDVNPVGIAFKVDQLIAEREPLGKTRLLLGAIGPALGAVRALAKGGSILDAVDREPKLPPKWLRPPERAAYPVGYGADKKISVDLDRVGAEFIERIVEHRRREGPTHEVDVWLDWQPDSGRARLGVHIGSQHVGTLTGASVEAYRPIMDAAAERDELPWTHGTVTRLLGSVPYLLTVTLPVLT